MSGWKLDINYSDIHIVRIYEKTLILPHPLPLSWWDTVQWLAIPMKWPGIYKQRDRDVLAPSKSWPHVHWVSWSLLHPCTQPREPGNSEWRNNWDFFLLEVFFGKQTGMQYWNSIFPVLSGRWNAPVLQHKLLCCDQKERASVVNGLQVGKFLLDFPVRVVWIPIPSRIPNTVPQWIVCLWHSTEGAAELCGWMAWEKRFQFTTLLNLRKRKPKSFVSQEGAVTPTSNLLAGAEQLDILKKKSDF